jgi:acetolactate synthase-1/2/3 large subunit
LNELARSPGDVMHPAALAQAIGNCLPRDALATFDGGHTTFWGNDFTPVTAPRTRFNEPGMSQLGFGLPWAMTLKLLQPERPVFNITGDGAFGFSLQELDTARRLGLAVITIIHNNASWGVIKLGFTKAGFEFGEGADYGTSLSGTDYAAIAVGFGCYGEIVERAGEFEPALQRAIKSGLPAVLDCRVRFEPHPGMPHFARMSAAGAT